ncbi:uncharacterized protein LOC131642702 [Vicia villosa]|uniref:uncharacterized protein LOC131642702 n=1 Tax=Vicia villosa TaxID=3911 RepID=UPI00273BA2B4|nr:uncharacterized protein LOC131642702 [Vicia villosa]
MANDLNNNGYIKPLVFDGENFEYWKDRIEISFLGQDPDLWDIVVDGYNHPEDTGVKIARKNMTDKQKKEFKSHHKARTFLLSAISQAEYEKITNRDTTHDIFESLKMTHEGNAQVKETKALDLIQKYEAFKMEEDKFIEAIFSRFQTLTTGLRVLNKGYMKADHAMEECSRHFKSECPKLQKERPKKRFERKKSLVATWDDSESSKDEYNSKDEHANIAFMATTDKDSDSEAETNEVFSELTRKELEESLSELLERHNRLRARFKKLKINLLVETKKLKQENAKLKDNSINS